MQSVVTAQQLTERIALLNPLQRQTIYQLIDFILNKNQAEAVADKKHLLLETSVWNEEDNRRIHEVQEDLNAWRIPT